MCGITIVYLVKYVVQNFRYDALKPWFAVLFEIISAAPYRDVVDHILSEDIAFIECSNKLCVKDDVVEEEALVCA